MIRTWSKRVIYAFALFGAVVFIDSVRLWGKEQ